MSKSTDRNDETVCNTICRAAELRADYLATQYGDSGSFADDIEDLRASTYYPVPVDQIAYLSKFTEGKVRGAIKRLEASGRIVDVTSRYGRHSKVYVSAESHAAIEREKRDARQEELTDRYGSRDSAADQVFALARMVNKRLYDRVREAQHAEDICEVVDGLCALHSALKALS